MRDLFYVAAGGRVLGTGHLRRSAEIVEIMRSEGLSVEALAVLSEERDRDILAPVEGVYDRVISLARFEELEPVGSWTVDVPEAFQGAVARLLEGRGKIVAALDWYRERADFECFNLRGGGDALRNAVIRGEFAPYFEGAGEEDRSGVVLVTGGTDPLGQWGQIAEHVAAFARRTRERVVFAKGPGVTLGSKARLEGLSILEEQRMLPKAMASAKLAVSNAGTGLLELAALGVPSVICPQSPQERAFAETFVGLGCAWRCPRRLEELDGMLASVLEDRVELERRGLLCRELVDGRGAQRIARAIVERVRQLKEGTL